MLAGDPQCRWVLRQKEGGMPEWWWVGAGKAWAVDIPPGARMVAPLPSGQGLMVVESDAWQELRMDPSGKRILGEKHAFPERLTLNHPRLDSTFLKVGSRSFLPIFSRQKLLLAEWQNGSISTRLLDLPAQVPHVNSAQGEQAFMVPTLVSDGQGLVWMSGGQALIWNPAQAQKILTFPPPTLRNMEQGAPFLVEGKLFWLIFGGQRGDLDSFGWRLVTQKSEPLFQGKGILTRFGLVRDQGPPRLMVWTISQKIRSQVWAAMSGNRTFDGTTLLWKDGAWRWHETLEIKMGKGKGEAAFDILWDVDVNGDGLHDLVAFDEKNDMRVFPCNSSFSYKGSPLSLNYEPEEVLRHEGKLFLASSDSRGWKVKEVKLP